MRRLTRNTAAAKAIRTAKWATTMTKWRNGFQTNGKRLGSPTVKPARRWQLVSFPGPAGRESAGIVDLMAIRKNHAKSDSRFKRGDLFEIILIQIKGAKRYNARDVVLAEWLKKARLKFYKLGKNHRNLERAWEEVDPGVLFR